MVRPLGHGVGAVACFLMAEIKADVASLLASALVADGRAAHLADLPVNDDVLRRARRDQHIEVDARLHDECPTIVLEGLTSAADLLAAPSHAKLRKQLARTERELGERAWSVDIATSRDEVAAAFERIGPLNDAAEADRPRLHFGQGAHGAFFSDALGSLADRRQVALMTLLVDGAPAAFDVHVRTNARRAAAILGRFHPDHASLSPGHLLLRCGVDWAIEEGLDVLDLQLGNDRYKTSWANAGYDTVDVVMADGDTSRVRASIAGIEQAYQLRRRATTLVDRVGRRLNDIRR
ncbi:MAG: GNAT family N-acetyltransferase [Acidimicrobiales bacterium]